jgi:hypothetical protein
LIFWWSPQSGTGSERLEIDFSPTRVSEEPFFSATVSMTRNASGASVAVMTGTPGLMMPAFSAAIFASVSPSHCW